MKRLGNVPTTEADLEALYAEEDRLEAAEELRNRNERQIEGKKLEDAYQNELMELFRAYMGAVSKESGGVPITKNSIFLGDYPTVLNDSPNQALIDAQDVAATIVGYDNALKEVEPDKAIGFTIFFDGLCDEEYGELDRIDITPELLYGKGNFRNPNGEEWSERSVECALFRMADASEDLDAAMGIIIEKTFQIKS